MDMIQLIPAVTPIVLGGISVLLLVAAIYYSMPWLAGLMGEARINRKLNALKSRGVTIMNHLLLADKKGTVIHIDNLIITNAQIIAVTTLGYAGSILGSIRGGAWVQETSHGSFRFPNPSIHHEAIKIVLHGILGERHKVRTITAFTAGGLQGNGGRDMVNADECTKLMDELGEGDISGAEQQWITESIQGVMLEDRREAKRKQAFITQQGDQKHLNIARSLMAASTLLMLLAIVVAGVRLAANRGLFG